MRAFLAVSPDDGLRAQVEALQRQLKAAIAQTSARITWTRPEQIHLTFRFFGDLDETMVEPLRTAVASVASHSSPLRMPLSRLGAFPRLESPRVIWLGPPPEWESTGDGRKAHALEAAIRRACAGLGIAADDAPWRPHLTLARIKDGERAAGRAFRDAGVFEHAALKGSLGVDAISLVRSEAGPAGHTHTTLWTEGLRPEA